MLVSVIYFSLSAASAEDLVCLFSKHLVVIWQTSGVVRNEDFGL